jgi:hypothetical protein
MCRRVSCKQCGKPTFAGCGAHVEQVLADVPQADRCDCSTKQGSQKKTSAPESRTWLQQLFGK